MDYLRQLASEVPTLNERFNRCLQDWGNETPPVTIIFAEVGEAIVENFATIHGEARKKIFILIENGMTSSNLGVKTAVATGLVEAMVAGADKKPDLWVEFKKLFGAASLKHAEAWLTFGR
ncbi:MAG TPA: hypothetical protein VG347_23635 [Verrucomicrobiae bacterium]|nr:hypothetical protein [Verrucomicrobiae bacterium]